MSRLFSGKPLAYNVKSVYNTKSVLLLLLGWIMASFSNGEVSTNQASSQSGGYHACTTEERASPSLDISRQQFTSRVVDKEPADLITFLSNEINPVYFFTEVQKGSGSHITHRWFHNDVLQAQVPLPISGNRWRTHSLKHIGFLNYGVWRIDVTDSNKCILSSHEIVFNSRSESKPKKALSTTNTQSLSESLGLQLGSVKKFIANQEFLDAELILKKALTEYDNKSSEYGKLSEMLTIELPMARISHKLNTDDLYLLEEDLGNVRNYTRNHSKESSYVIQLSILEQRLNSRLDGYNTETQATISAFEQSLAMGYQLTGSLPTDKGAAQELLPDKHWLINDFSSNDNEFTFILTDKRTGKVYERSANLSL